MRHRHVRGRSQLWIVESSRPLVRGSLELGTAPIMKWVPAPSFGEHASRADAVRAIVRFIEPDVSPHATQAFVESHYQAWARNVKTLRVRRVS